MDQPVPPEITPEILEQYRRHLQQEQVREATYGKVRPIIHADFQGYKFIAAGNRLFYGKWKTVPDFLSAYLKQTLNPAWGSAELQKPLEKRHQILRWYDGMCQHEQQQVRGADGLYDAVPNGAMAAWYQLAYDLYILRDRGALQERILQRLKHPDQFQGARYELFVAATCIRAGCEVAYEDEGDVTQKHAEFIATHRVTGQKLSVEAKSRHRPGVLGRPGRRDPEGEAQVGIRRLLREALGKATANPLVVFMDLNMPPAPRPVFEMRWFQEIVDTVGEVGGHARGEPDPFNMIAFTNHPQHYGDDVSPTPMRANFFAISQNPRVPMAHAEVLQALAQAADIHGSIPSTFD